MPVKDIDIERETFFGDPALDRDLPMVNEVFWSSLIAHIERDCNASTRVILDVGCHTGDLLSNVCSVLWGVLGDCDAEGNAGCYL